ncbi:helix-turn-helix transcriptional regulator [Rickettsiella massiliensis]|uniref:helix-turn-helix transcriptional regulator n=1 Tax=Rickettsiella massiliensis TaxID=676517 RepID=UPI00029ABA16|nr:helix-turn-helix transcriptional regulator [Rickettsiella massiliensis]
MVAQRINRSDFECKLREEENHFFEILAKLYLQFFGNKKPTKTQLIEMKSLISHVCVIRPLNLNNRLTRREKQCLLLSTQGKKIARIAKFMKITPHMVNMHKRNIFLKLNCKSMSQAITKAISYGLLEQPINELSTT